MFEALNGTTYYYVVTAVNSNGESGNSNQASATPQAPAPPAAPTNLTATAGNAQVSLSWTASTGAASYKVKRATVSGGPYSIIASPTGTAYSDTSVTNGTTYYYVVSAVNAGGESANSNQAQATPTAPPPVLSSLTLNPTSVVGSNTSTGTVTLTSAAPTGGVNVALSSSHAAVTVPTSVSVAAGAVSATFTVTTTAVTTTATASISATYAGVTRTATLTVTPPPAPNPQVPQGGTATFAAPGDEAPATGGWDITNPNGQIIANADTPNGWDVVDESEFDTDLKVTAPADAPIAANYKVRSYQIEPGNRRSSPFDVVAGGGQVTLLSLTLNPTSVVGGDTSIGTVTLSGAAPAGGITVQLSSSNPTVASPQATVTVAAGQSSATFTLNSSQVATTQTATITASNNGITKTAVLTVNPPSSPPALSGLTLNPTSVVGGRTATGTVTLSGAAPAGGTVVELSCPSTVVSGPSSVTVPEGQSSKTFTISTQAVQEVTTAVVTASYDGANKTASLQVTPRFAITNINNGDVLSGYVQVNFKVYDAATPVGDNWRLWIGDKRFSSGVALASTANTRTLTFSLETYLFSNGQHTLQVTDQAGNVTTRTVSFSNAASNVLFTPVFDTTGASPVGATCAIKATVASGTSWTVTIVGYKDVTAKTFSGNGPSIDLVWNGSDDAGAQTKAGNYKLYIKVNAAAGTASAMSRSQRIRGLGTHRRRSRTSTMRPMGAGDQIGGALGELVGIINNIKTSDTLVLMDTNLTGGLFEAWRYEDIFLGHIYAGNTQAFDVNSVVPLIISEWEFSVPLWKDTLLNLINWKFSQPLKFIYVLAHGRSYSVPQFRVGEYRWLSGDPGTDIGEGEAWDPAKHFIVSDLAAGLQYGEAVDGTDPPGLVWIDTCGSAGGVGSINDWPPGNALPGERAIGGVNMGWDECFGISKGVLNGYQCVFLGWSGTTPTYGLSSREPAYYNWNVWRESFWCFVFRDHRNIGTTHYDATNPAFLPPLCAIDRADKMAVTGQDPSVPEQPHILRRATGQGQTAF